MVGPCCTWYANRPPSSANPSDWRITHSCSGPRTPSTTAQNLRSRDSMTAMCWLSGLATVSASFVPSVGILYSSVSATFTFGRAAGGTDARAVDEPGGGTGAG